MATLIKSIKLKAFFERHFTSTIENNTNIEHELQLACAALMFELTRADGEIQENEIKHLLTVLQNKYELTTEETDELIELARDKMHNATDYYQFTSLLNEHYTQDQKRLLVRHLWELALADREIDKHEEHLIRNLAELLHVPHSAFMQMKHKALESL